MKKRFFSLLFVVCITILALVGLTSCDEALPAAKPQKLSAPVVTLTDNVASWGADSNADKFEISLDGNLSYVENSVTSQTLTDGQTFKIRAVGDGNSYSTSDWSNSVTYTTVTSDDTTPNDTIPEDSIPEDTTPEDTTPEDTTPEDTTPNDTIPEDTTPEAMTGTVISAGGYYQLTVSYAEAAGKDNVANENEITHSSIIFIRDLSDAKYQVKKAEGIEIDGAIDEAYMHTASISSAYQAPYTGENPAAIVNPYEYIGMTKISNIGNIPVPADTSVTLRVLWGEEEVAGATTPYLYVIIDVTDTTNFARTAKYTAYRNAWINDSVEFTYKLGGYNVPVIGDTDPDTYPVYSTVLVDGREKAATDAGNHTAVFAQQSVFFNDIVSATARKTNGYIVELKIPAKSESYTGLYGGEDFTKVAGDALEAGEFVFLCLQLNDLTGLPDGKTAEQYDAQIDSFVVEDKYPNKWSTTPQGEWADFESAAQQFVYCSGNRNKAYLQTSGAGPAVFQLSEYDWQE